MPTIDTPTPTPTHSPAPSHHHPPLLRRNRHNAQTSRFVQCRAWTREKSEWLACDGPSWSGLLPSSCALEPLRPCADDVDPPRLSQRTPFILQSASGTQSERIHAELLVGRKAPPTSSVCSLRVPRRESPFAKKSWWSWSSRYPSIATSSDEVISSLCLLAAHQAVPHTMQQKIETKTCCWGSH